MNASGKLNLGIVGACGRGASFKSACDALGQVAIHAVCDSNTKDLAAARERLGAREQYADFAEMLEKSDLDAVIIGTPMHFHAPQAVAALEHNLHVLSEVTAAVSVAECQAMDMTLPGLVSQQSILEGGRWIEVPDSRTWAGGAPPPAR